MLHEVAARHELRLESTSKGLGCQQRVRALCGPNRVWSTSEAPNRVRRTRGKARLTTTTRHIRYGTSSPSRATMDDTTTGYDNTHRAFLQALLSRQTLTHTTAKPLLAKIQTAHNPSRPVVPEDITLEDFTYYIDTLNSALSAFDFEIRSSIPQARSPNHAPGEEVWALVNVSSDALTQMATSHSADEIAFVKRMLDLMFDTYNTPRAEVMAVTAQQAFQVAKAPSEGRRESGTQNDAAASSLTLAQAEHVLKILTNEGWLDLSDRYYYSLSPRALMELRGWLLDTYNDQPTPDDEDEEVPHEKIKFCAACREIVTVGQRCPDPDLACPARLHHQCVGKMWRAQGGREECPSCKREWAEPLPVGEKAARRVRPSSNANGGRRRTTDHGNMDGADDSE